MNETIVGIDLGTTYSAIGVVDSGFPMLLAGWIGLFGPDVAAMLSNDDGGFQFKVQLLEMIGHAGNFTWALNGIVVGKIKYRV